MQINAYAKINLTLDITGRREDGFHTLDTVMQSVSLYDEVELTLGDKPGVELTCNRDYLPVDGKNTAYRAAQAFLERQGLSQAGVIISIRKHIPSRAGMGGGSADAAAVLHGMNRLFAAGLSTDALMELGEKIGADVPFCVHGGACRCTGIGENLVPLKPMPDCFLVICKPPAGMSTPRAYALIDRYPLSEVRKTPNMLSALSSGDLKKVGKALGNRFDEVMKLPQVRELEKAMLAAGALGAMMTGSGSAVYGLFDGERKARACMQSLEGKGKLFLARPCTGRQQPDSGQ